MNANFVILPSKVKKKQSANFIPLVHSYMLLCARGCVVKWIITITNKKTFKKTNQSFTREESSLDLTCHLISIVHLLLCQTSQEMNNSTHLYIIVYVLPNQIFQEISGTLVGSIHILYEIAGDSQ